MAQKLITLLARWRHSEDAVFAARMRALCDSAQNRGPHRQGLVSPFRGPGRAV